MLIGCTSGKACAKWEDSPALALLGAVSGSSASWVLAPLSRISGRSRRAGCEVTPLSMDVKSKGERRTTLSGSCSIATHRSRMHLLKKALPRRHACQGTRRQGHSRLQTVPYRTLKGTGWHVAEYEGALVGDVRVEAIIPTYIRTRHDFGVDSARRHAASLGTSSANVGRFAGSPCQHCCITPTY
jgi:hypothetical protein